jgi:hypothetical protein
MREINLLRHYPTSNTQRGHVSKIRGIREKIVASRRDFEYFDGERIYGYGGLIQDYRWDPVALDFIDNYQLTRKSSIIQINCEKGYLINSFSTFLKSNKIFGTESSSYAISKSFNLDNYKIIQSNLPGIPFSDCSVDIVISLGNVYTLTLPDAIKHLAEIERVKKYRSFITLATYENEEDFWLFKNWSLLGNLILKREEWLEIMNQSGYTGDYYFINATHLGLKK